MSIEYSEWSGYPLWIDAYGKKHDIKDMNDKYIYSCYNCLKNIEKICYMLTVDQLPKDKQKEIDIPLSEAWFLTYGQIYIKAFETEIKQRKI